MTLTDREQRALEAIKASVREDRIVHLDGKPHFVDLGQIGD